MKSNNELDNILDNTTASIRNEQVDSAVVKQAADRVWARVAIEAAGDTTIERGAAELIESCADFQSLIPAYLQGQLSEARSLLLVDHTHECIPCRRAMKEARTRKSVPVRTTARVRRYGIQPVVLRWGIAAALVIGFGLLALPVLQRYLPLGGQLEATVQAAEGQVFQIADTRTTPVTVGQKLGSGERLRTAKDGHAFVKLADGSIVEIRDRSELSITKNGQGTTIHLNRGAIVVEAAKQKSQRLYVDTGDSLVSVVGTVFSVNSGTKGSRVSVIEGEVHMNHAGADRVLRPGDQFATSRSIERVAVGDEVSWSRNATRYAETLANLAGLGKEINKVPQPELRYSTRLLDLMPAGTTVYAALPNLTATITESHQIMQNRINQNPALREWYEKNRAGGPDMNKVMETVHEFGQYLGDEVAVSVAMDAKGEPVAPLVLAELKNSEGFRAFLEQQLAKHSGNSSGRTPITFVEDPQLATPSAPAQGSKDKDVYVWIRNDLFAASPNLSQLQQLSIVLQKGGKSDFSNSPFYDRIAQVYGQGAGLVVAANLERVFEQTKSQRTQGAGAEQREAALNKLGVLSVKYFVLDQKQTGGKTHTEAVLSFNEAQRGVPSWLAAPGPMGSLEYISPEANVVAGFVVKDPVALVDDLLGVVETVSPDLRKNLDKLQADRGIDIRRDIAAPLGGEFAFAIDGPILPTPSWKMVFEVNDVDHLQRALQQVVNEINKEAARFGKAGLVWEQGDLSGRPYYTLRSADFGLEVNYTYVNGYMVVGPTRALVERSVRAQSQNYSLLRSQKFIAGLPADGNANFSAVFYHNLAPLVQPFADKIAGAAGNLPQGPQNAIKSLAADMPPTLAYAYAREDSITFAANTEGGPFGLSPATLLGVPHALEMQHILQQGMRGKK
ncbi:MAG TPA: FecR domain-containing protein [Pyrinomonadaceae bacterium]|nr:FecR domain-containing protein [Pyrinomonadaceae bacterium]